MSTDPTPAEATDRGTPYVGGRMLLEAGDSVEVIEYDTERVEVSRRRATVKHTKGADGQSMWQTPLAVFLDDHARAATPAEPASGDLADLGDAARRIEHTGHLWRNAPVVTDALRLLVDHANATVRAPIAAPEAPGGLTTPALIASTLRRWGADLREEAAEGSAAAFVGIKLADAADAVTMLTPRGEEPEGAELARWSARHFTQEEAENEPPGWSIGWNVIGEVGEDPDPLVRIYYALAIDQAHDGDGGDCSAWLARNVAATLNASRTPAPIDVTICGSMRHIDTIRDVAARLTADGLIVVIPHPVADDTDRTGLDALHRRAIDRSTRVVAVVGPDGPGESTAAEIKHAHRHGIPVEIIDAPGVETERGEEGELLRSYRGVRDVCEAAGLTGWDGGWESDRVRVYAPRGPSDQTDDVTVEVDGHEVAGMTVDSPRAVLAAVLAATPTPSAAPAAGTGEELADEFGAAYDAGQRDTIKMLRSTLTAIDPDLRATPSGDDTAESGGERDFAVDPSPRILAAEARRAMARLLDDSSLGTPGARAMRKRGAGEELTAEEERAADRELASLERDLTARDDDTGDGEDRG